MFVANSQVFCKIFGVEIYNYGVILAIAVMCGFYVAEKISTKFFKLPKDTMYDIAPFVIILGIIFARLYYCILNYPFYLRFPTEIFAIRHGGISIHGAILGGLIGLLIYSKFNKISFWKLADVSSVGLALGQSIGRWGNFFNSEAFGLPTNLPWKLFIAPEYRPVQFANYEYFHPTFLYESILDLGIFFVLLFFVHKRVFKIDGNLALTYLIMYSLARIFVELIRVDSVAYIYNIPIAIHISLGIIILSTILFLCRNIRLGKRL